MACGKPVVALGRGGATETIVDGKTGLFFDEASPRSLGRSLDRLDATQWDPRVIRNHALRFGRSRFEREIDAWLNAEGCPVTDSVDRTWDRSSAASV